MKYRFAIVCEIESDEELDGDAIAEIGFSITNSATDTVDFVCDSIWVDHTDARVWADTLGRSER